MTWLIVASSRRWSLVLVVFGAWAYRTANRLDRLHVRYDLSWQALDGALARRAVVARAVAIDAYGGASEGRRLAALADAAEGCAAARARDARKRALGRAGHRRSGVAARRSDRRAGRRRGPGGVGPPIPQRRGPGHPGAGRTAPGAAVSTSAGPPRCPAISRSSSGRTRWPTAILRRPQPPHLGAHRAARRPRRRVCVRIGSRARRPRHARVVVHRGRRSGRKESGWPRPPRGSWPKKPVCGSRRPRWSGRCGGATGSSSSTAR